MGTSSVRPRHYTTIFCIALSTIAVQILLSRIFSVTLYYHFAFACITLAMLGLTAGALKVYLDPERFSAARADEALSDFCSRFAINLTAAVLVHIICPALLAYWNPTDFLNQGIYYGSSIGLSILILLFAFIDAGVCIALLLTRFPAHMGMLYAFDLGGAALGCIAVLTAITFVDPISFLFLIATMIAVVAWALMPPYTARRRQWRIRLTAIIMLPLCVFQTASYLNDTPAFHLMWAKKSIIASSYGFSHMTPQLQSIILEPPKYERWNTYSHVMISDNLEGDPWGWGFGSPHKENVTRKFLAIDFGAGTVITRFNGDVSQVDYLKDDLVNLAYHVRPVGEVAAIGVGGGRDILSALAFKAKHVRGLEINPVIFDALTNVYGDFSGHLEKLPEVSLVNAEARSYLNSHTDHYDLIQISLIDTWATTAAGGLTLTENKLYTTDAWQDFMERLNDNGMLAVTRWYNEHGHPGEYYRLLAIAGKMLRARLPEANPRDYILAATVSDSLVTVIVSKSPLTTADVKRFKDACKKHHFRPILTPSYSYNPEATQILSTPEDGALFRDSPYDFSAPTDDRPFFFNMVRFSSMFLPHQDINLNTMNTVNDTASISLFRLCVFTILASLVYIGWPMWRLWRKHEASLAGTAPHMLYFTAIGLGFMLIEISQMQRLMIFLGHPAYGLSVVLFTLLLSSSLGSYAQESFFRKARPWLVPLCLCMVLVITGLTTPYLMEHLKYYDTTIRIVSSALLLAPAGFLMGTMLPAGMAFASDQGNLRSWYWGLNGMASVFASVLGIILSLQYGFTATFWLGVLCYGLCLWLATRRT